MRAATSLGQDDSVSAGGRDHVARLVEQYFEVRDNELYVGGLPVTQLCADYGSPLFVYDHSALARRSRQLERILPSRFSLYYSIKANPNSALLRYFLQRGCGLEVASQGELFQALDAGCPPERILYAGPGKTRADLAAAVSAGIREIHVESVDEAHCLNDVAKSAGRVAAIALRINPDEGSGGAMQMGGRPSPFGIDEESLDEAVDEMAAMRHVRIAGVHLYMATQILDADVLIGQYRVALGIARKVARRMPQPLQTIDFGGGWGTPYFAHESELDLRKVAAGIKAVASEMEHDALLSGAEAIIEPGRFLVNEAGLYLARVTRVKKSRGKVYAVTDGGMHHHLAASGNLGQTIKRNYPVAIANKLGLPSTDTVDVVGPLCTPLDVLARQAKLPAVEADDIFAVFQSGAYARTSSPHGFLSHSSPAEVMVGDGKARVIRRRGRPEDFVSDQPEPVSGGRMAARARGRS